MTDSVLSSKENFLNGTSKSPSKSHVERVRGGGGRKLDDYGKDLLIAEGIKVLDRDFNNTEQFRETLDKIAEYQFYRKPINGLSANSENKLSPREADLLFTSFQHEFREAEGWKQSGAKVQSMVTADASLNEIKTAMDAKITELGLNNSQRGASK